MTYKCIGCGAEVEYDTIVEDSMMCTKCTVKRSNIWIKKRPKGVMNTVIAR
jgi:DNA-directed RNA polymerase subunit RPC12/RpoP